MSEPSLKSDASYIRPDLTDAESVIEVSGLVTHYGTREILHGIDFEVRQGEIMVIMGGSGSGKSTLLRALLGLLRPTSGAVRILKEDLNTISDVERTKLRRKMGVAFQGGALFSSLNVLENIILPLREHTNLDLNTMHIMARMKMQVVNLSGFEELMPAELSGGMIKRAAFARAIVMDPQVLFCDEPSAGLAPVVASAIDDLILLLRDAMGMSIVVVTHELESAFRIADRICVLDNGHVLMVGTVDEVKSSDSERIQNLLNRRTGEVELDPEEYLRRLTEGQRLGSR